MKAAPMFLSRDLALLLGAVELDPISPALRPDACVRAWRESAEKAGAAGQFLVLAEGGSVLAWPALSDLPCVSRVVREGRNLTVSRPCDCTCEGACDEPLCPRK